MNKKVPAQTTAKISKLVELMEDTSHNVGFAISITRLTILKSLCEDPTVATEFALYIARLTKDKIIKKVDSANNVSEEILSYKDLATKAVSALEVYVENPLTRDALALHKHLSTLQAVQDKYERIGWNTVRIIKSMDLLIIEKALRCALATDSHGHWAYHLARDYAEKYEPTQGTGLILKSAPMVEDIANFWCQYYFKQSAKEWLASKNRKPPIEPKQSENKVSKLKVVTSTSSVKKSTKIDSKTSTVTSPEKYTTKQGQYLAFIYYYTKIHKRAPAEADIQEYFETTSSNVHQMIVTLKEKGLIEQLTGKARSIKLLLSREELPDLV